MIEEARKAGATIGREPGETFWGGYSGVFIDPDGHPWEVAHNPRWTIEDDGSLTLPPTDRGPQPRTGADARLRESAADGEFPASRPQAVLPRARGADPRALARARRLPPLARQPRGRAALELLRGPADRQRPARLPPRPRPRLQGHLPALPGRCAGYRVPRKAGWDCHGLPVELEVEKQLGITSKQEIEEFGIAEFNQRCRESVFEYVEEWNRLTERIGFWIDLDDPYVTLDDDYIESVWWSLRQLWDDERLYEGHKVVPYCPRYGTALSSHEVALGYQDVEDPSVYVQLPVLDDGEGRSSRRCAAGLDDDALDPARQRGRRRRRRRSTTSGPASATRSSSSPATASSRCWARRPRCSRISRARRSRAPRTSPPSTTSPTTARAATPSCSPTSSPPRTAPAWSTSPPPSARTTSASASSTGSRCTTRSTSTAASTSGSRTSRAASSRTRTPTSSRPSSAKGLLLREEVYEHAYPHCWRCGTPLLYYAKSSWYVATSEVRDRTARQQRDDRLAPRAHQARPLRQMAGEQRRLGALARPLLGHAAADLGVRRRRTATSASAPARSPSCASGRRRGPRRPPPPLHRRGRSLRLREAAAARCAGSSR